MNKVKLAAVLTLSFLVHSVFAATPSSLDELDPYASDIQEQLQALDKDYQESTGHSPILQELGFGLFNFNNCYQLSCSVFVKVSKQNQTLELYEHGILSAVWDVSTGAPGRETPDFDQHPNGRVYDAYSSKKFPGGDYNGLGNMPYAVFIRDGFAIHGTGRGNWALLGTKASHGCIRVHPDNAFTFNRLVRTYGVMDTWITVE